MHRIRQALRGSGAILAQRLAVPALPRRDRERGQGLVEYSLIIVLIGVAVIIVVGLIGHQIANVFSNVSSGLGS